MQTACDSDCRCGLACDASARDATSLARAMRVTKLGTVSELWCCQMISAWKSPATSTLIRVFDSVTVCSRFRFWRFLRGRVFFLCISVQFNTGTGPVLVSVPENRFRRFPDRSGSKLATHVQLLVNREGPSYGSRRYGSAFFGPNEIWPFSLELSPSISGKIKERTRFAKC